MLATLQQIGAFNQRMAKTGSASSLLELPDSCLLAVLQHCAADGQRSLFNAARAHSRLHQAAVAALRSISASVPTSQQLSDVMQYLAKHGKHLDSISLKARSYNVVLFEQLPPDLQVRSLQLEKFCFQLLPGNSSEGMLGTAGTAALKQLRLIECKLLDGDDPEELAAAVAKLPAGLEHLSISALRDLKWQYVECPTGALQHLQRLTYLELSGIKLRGPGQGQHTLQPLQALTKIADLRLATAGEALSIIAGVLPSAQHLTRLELQYCKLGPGTLASMTQLQHLQLEACGSGDEAQLLSQLPLLQELTHLSMERSLETAADGTTPSATAYSALTACSQLQHLAISRCTLPVGAWQHVFPAGKQLPYLLSLDISEVRDLSGDAALAPEGSLLTTCCPGLQSLDMQGLQYTTDSALNADLLAPLSGLSGLHTLSLADHRQYEEVAKVWLTVCRLTGLRRLDVDCCAWIEGDRLLLLQLTQLKQLTSLFYSGPFGCYDTTVRLSDEGADEPVWRQIIQHNLTRGDLNAKQQAAAALAMENDLS